MKNTTKINSVCGKVLTGLALTAIVGTTVGLPIMQTTNITAYAAEGNVKSQNTPPKQVDTVLHKYKKVKSDAQAPVKGSGVGYNDAVATNDGVNNPFNGLDGWAKYNPEKDGALVYKAIGINPGDFTKRSVTLDAYKAEFPDDAEGIAEMQRLNDDPSYNDYMRMLQMSYNKLMTEELANSKPLSKMTSVDLASLTTEVRLNYYEKFLPNSVSQFSGDESVATAANEITVTADANGDLSFPGLQAYRDRTGQTHANYQGNIYIFMVSEISPNVTNKFELSNPVVTLLPMNEPGDTDKYLTEAHLYPKTVLNEVRIKIGSGLIENNSPKSMLDDNNLKPEDGVTKLGVKAKYDVYKGVPADFKNETGKPELITSAIEADDEGFITLQNIENGDYFLVKQGDEGYYKPIQETDEKDPVLGAVIKSTPKISVNAKADVNNTNTFKIDGNRVNYTDRQMYSEETNDGNITTTFRTLDFETPETFTYNVYDANTAYAGAKVSQKVVVEMPKNISKENKSVSLVTTRDKDENMAVTAKEPGYDNMSVKIKPDVNMKGFVKPAEGETKHNTKVSIGQRLEGQNANNFGKLRLPSGLDSVDLNSGLVNKIELPAEAYTEVVDDEGNLTVQLDTDNSKVKTALGLALYNGSAPTMEITYNVTMKGIDDTKKPTKPEDFVGTRNEVVQETKMVGEGTTLVSTNGVNTPIYKYSGQKFKKVEGNMITSALTDKGLQGAQFLIKQKETNSKINKEQYVYFENGEVRWTRDKDEAVSKGVVNTAEGKTNGSLFESDSNGQFDLFGLQAGDYEMVEYKAPNGYAKSNKPVPFTVDTTTYFNNEIRIGNDNAVLPPLTGSRVVMITIVAGVAGVAIYFVLKNKKDDEGTQDDNVSGE